jgi:hypothetical protein
MVTHYNQTCNTHKQLHVAHRVMNSAETPFTTIFQGLDISASKFLDKLWHFEILIIARGAGFAPRCNSCFATVKQLLRFKEASIVQ